MPGVVHSQHPAVSRSQLKILSIYLQRLYGLHCYDHIGLQRVLSLYSNVSCPQLRAV